MEKTTSRILIETIVKKTLQDIKDSPERSTRNLVDMALQFSKGRFQTSFFRTAQRMLKNENSAYYRLVHDTVTHVETDRLLSFGMTLGYNSCTTGAQIIRAKEKELKCNIPWAIPLQIDSGFFPARRREYLRSIQEGNQLGIYSWILFVENQAKEVLSLASENSESCFFLFCNPGEITPEFADSVSLLNNLMTVVRYDDGAADACTLLRNTGLLYSLFYPYSQPDVEEITNGGLFYSMQELHPVFSILYSLPDCPYTTQQLVHQTVLKARSEQQYQTLLWELYRDNCMIDEIISDDACFIGFDKDGNLCQWNERLKKEKDNLFLYPLSEIIRQALQK